MPDDWVNIAGGNALAGSFRPSYDLMFAPNNVVGLSLVNPTGTTAASVAFTAAGSTATTLVLNTTAFLATGSVVTVGTSTTAQAVTVLSGTAIAISPGLTAAPAAGTQVFLLAGVPFEGPYSLVDIPGFTGSTGGGAAISNLGTASQTRDTTQGDGTVDWWDAPMPPANISVAIRGTGFIKQVIKSDVYYLGTPNSTAQIYPNPYYVSNIPESPYLPANAAGGGFLWNSWGSDGPYTAGAWRARSAQPVLRLLRPRILRPAVAARAPTPSGSLPSLVRTALVSAKPCPATTRLNWPTSAAPMATRRSLAT